MNRSKIYATLLLVVTVLVSVGAASVLKSDRKSDKADEKFLRKIADARMMDWAEGELAAERGTKAEIKAYGERMVKEQDELMNEIKRLAGAENIVLPQALSKEKADALDDLKEKAGKDFDKLFTKMIIKDHKRDLKDFKRAAKSDDPEISAFAKKYLPTIQDHLRDAQALKK